MKGLGKTPATSRIVAHPVHLSTLLEYITSKDVEASNEALRCVANALLLVEDSRGALLSVEVNGGSVIVELLEVWLFGME